MASSKYSFLTINTILLLNVTSTTAYAGGFQMHEQNGSVGDVHAGYAVDNDDASVNFYNPAALTDILEAKTTTSAVTVANSVSFKGSTSLEANPKNTYAPVVASGRASTEGLHVIPSVHYATPINNQFAFGLSVVSPFAAELSWSKKAFTRYNSTTNGIKAVNFSPSFAYKLNEQLSFGLGGDAQYVSMQIEKIVGTNFNPMPPYPMPLKDLDSEVSNNLSHTGFGWHTGVLWKPLDSTKFGFNYRSGINHQASGTSTLKGKLAGSYLSPSDKKKNKSKNLKAVIKIPQSFAFSAQFTPIQDWSFVSTAIYTNWAVVRSFDLRNTPTAFTDPYTEELIFSNLVSTPLGLRDTYTFLNGIHWNYSDQVKLKAGLGFDQTPTSNHIRDLKMPDGNRYLFGLGANYKYSHDLNFEFGWMYVLINKTKISNSSSISETEIDPSLGIFNPGEKNDIHGHAKGSAHVIGLQFTLNTDNIYGYAHRRMSTYS